MKKPLPGQTMNRSPENCLRSQVYCTILLSNYKIRIAASNDRKKKKNTFPVIDPDLRNTDYEIVMHKVIDHLKTRRGLAPAASLQAKNQISQFEKIGQ